MEASYTPQTCPLQRALAQNSDVQARVGSLTSSSNTTTIHFHYEAYHQQVNISLALTRVMAGKVTLRPVPSHPDILLALDLMSTTEPRFHWYLFIPDAPTTSPDRNPHGGIKLHAITNGKQGEEKRWSYDRTPLSLATSPAVAAAAIIGRLPQGKTVDDLDALLQGIALEVPEVDREREPVFTCRVWIREALRRMHAGGYIARNDVDAMEEEMWGYGKAAAAQIEDDTFECAVLEDAMNI